MTLHDKLTKIQVELKVKKARLNKFGKYNFRSAEDILEAIKPFLTELGLSLKVVEELVDSEHNFGFPMIKSTAYITDGKESISANAIVGVDLDQKGMATSQQFGSSSSYGKKYALGNLFLIDDTQDSDATNDHKPKVKATQAAKPILHAKTKQYNAAVKYLEEGGDIKTIKLKYDVSEDLEESLLKLK